MLDRWMVRKLSERDCLWEIEDIERSKVLTVERLKRLEATKAKNPGWAAYDKYAEDIVGIDIRIEEQQAVAGMLDDDLKLLNLRLDAIMGLKAMFGDTHGLGKPAYQLGFFDTAKKRARMGVPC